MRKRGKKEGRGKKGRERGRKGGREEVKRSAHK